MGKGRTTARRGLASEDLTTWPQVEELALPEASRATFRARMVAVKMYASGDALKEIKKETGISKQELYRFCDRCRAPADDGRIMGFRALVDHSHIPSLRRRSQEMLEGRKARSGALGALFALFPSIAERVREYAVTGKKTPNSKAEVNVPPRSIHSFFLVLCREAGIKSPAYPFIEESRGFPAIRRFVKEQRTLHALRYLGTGDPEAARKARPSTDPEFAITPTSRLLHRMQCDGCKLNVSLIVEFDSPNGIGKIRKRILRIWIVLLIEVMSKAIWGYSLAFGHNYSGTDVARAIRNSFRPWKPRQLVIPELQYRPSDGFPSGSVEGLAYACFDELWLDNAKAHLSEYFLGNLERSVNAVGVFGAVEEPNTRPLVEGFFGTLAALGINRMPGTTGSSPDDPRRPRRNNGDYDLNERELADIVDVLIARINGSPAPGSTETRLEILKRVVNEGTCIIRRVPMDRRATVLQRDLCERVTIGSEHGRPVVRTLSARYNSQALSSAAGLIGRSGMAIGNSDDVRELELVLDNGSSLGVLLVEPRWRNTPHSLKTRRMVKQLENAGVLTANCEDIVDAARRYLEAKGRTSTIAATQYARMAAEEAARAQACMAESAVGASNTELGVEATAAVTVVRETSLTPEIADFLNNMGTIFR